MKVKTRLLKQEYVAECNTEKDSIFFPILLFQGWDRIESVWNLIERIYIKRERKNGN